MQTLGDRQAFEELKPGHAHGRILDVTDDAAVSRVMAEVERSVGPLDVVVANAGHGLEGTFAETPLAEARRQFAVNVFGAVATLQAPLPHMRRRRRGHLMASPPWAGSWPSSLGPLPARQLHSASLPFPATAARSAPAADAPARHHTVGRRSASRPRMRTSISSRIGRTAAMP